MIKNKTRKTVIAKAFERLEGLNKMKGLMLNERGPVVFKTRFGIHTFTLKKPIDLLVLDRKNRVKVLRKEVSPNRVVVWNILYYLVIELPSGSIEKSNTQKEDLIEFSS